MKKLLFPALILVVAAVLFLNYRDVPQEPKAPAIAARPQAAVNPPSPTKATEAQPERVRMVHSIGSSLDNTSSNNKQSSTSL